MAERGISSRSRELNGLDRRQRDLGLGAEFLFTDAVATARETGSWGGAPESLVRNIW